MLLPLVIIGGFTDFPQLYFSNVFNRDVEVCQCKQISGNNNNKIFQVCKEEKNKKG